MPSRVRTVPLISCLLAVLATGCAAAGRNHRSATPQGSSSYGRLPVAFEPNEGQLDHRARFAARGAGYAIFLTRAGATVAFAGSRAGRSFSVGLLGASRRVTLSGEDPLSERVNSFTGNDPARWRTGIPTFGGVRYRSVWPGIDAIFHGGRGALGFDFAVKPGARPSEVALAFHGDTGRFTEPPPIAFQLTDRHRVPVRARYRAASHGRVTLEVGRYDHTRPLIVDPTLMYSTYLGGHGGDQAAGVTVDASDHAFVTGTTASVDFPRARAGQRRPGGGRSDSFVAELAPTGNGLVYSTFLGGRGDEHGTGIAIDPASDAFVTGVTTSMNFPIKRAVQAMPAGGADAYVAKLDARGRLLYSTYLGGSGNDAGAGIAADRSGTAYVTGSTSSTDFPTNAPLQKTFAGGVPDGDAFVAKIASVAHACTVSDDFTVNAPPFNGLGFEGPKAVTVPTNASVLTTTITDTATGRIPAAQPWTGVTWKKSYEGRMRQGVDPNYRRDGYLVVLEFDGSGNPNQPMGPNQTWRYSVVYQVPGACPAGARRVSGNNLAYSTYLGGTGDDAGNGIAVDRAGNAYVTGVTASSDFPTRTPIQSSLRPGPGGTNAFVTKLDRTGTNLVYSTYLGGTGSIDSTNGARLGDGANAIAVDAAGDAYVTGSTASPDFPAIHAQQLHSASGADDAFVTKLSQDGTAYVYSTYLGGTDHDRALGIAVDSSGDAFVSGQTSSRDFPIKAAPQPGYGGGGDDAFVTEYNPDGTKLVYSTYVGGSAVDIGFGIAVDGAADAFVAGATESPNLPTASALQRSLRGGSDAFISEIPAGGVGGPGPAVLVPGFLFNKVCPVWYFPNPIPGTGGVLKITVNCNSQGSVTATGYVVIGKASCPTLQCVQHRAVIAARPKLIPLRLVFRRVVLGRPGEVTIRLGPALRAIRAARRRHQAVSLIVLARFTARGRVRSKPVSIRIAQLR
jgi:Beta-propeller repeat